MINEIFDSLIHEDTDTAYYHLSDKDYGAKVEFTPRNPDIDGESNLPRICVAPTIEGALVALGKMLYGALHVFIYQVTGDPEIIAANRSVSDRKVTGEMWVLDPTVFEQMGRVPLHKIPKGLWNELRTLEVGDKSTVPEQEEIKGKLKPYVSSIPRSSGYPPQILRKAAGAAEAIDDAEDGKIRTVPAPMNFDRARARNK